jgi:hypothetical protein
MICASYGATDTQANSNRVQWMEMLFMLEGRDKRDHPKCGLFTGLHRKHFSTFPGVDEN